MTSISNADSSTGKKSKLLWFGFGLILITLLLASSALYMNVRNRESDLEDVLEKQETMFATGRGEVLEFSSVSLVFHENDIYAYDSVGNAGGSENHVQEIKKISIGD